jgi:hypothetical protein
VGALKGDSADPNEPAVLAIHSGAGYGVAAQSTSSAGARGTSASGRGVEGVSTSGEGVVGVTTSGGAAVWGQSDGVGAGVLGVSKLGEGVRGVSQVAEHGGVVGINNSGGHAGYFQGPVQVDGNLNVSNGFLTVGTAGTRVIFPCQVEAFSVKVNEHLLANNATVEGHLSVRGIDVPQGADVAEQFGVVGELTVEPGCVVVLAGDDNVRVSEEPYDRRVAGVVSGAGGYRAALVLDRSGADRRPLALTGKVWCKVDADCAPVEVGDLLTTSSTPGHAMRATDPARAFGAVIGKALGRLQSGCGLVPVLVALQ